MSFLHCACTKARVEDSPKSSTPYSRDSPYTPLVVAATDDRYMPSETAGASSSDSMITFETDPTFYELYTVIGRGCNDSATITLAKHVPSGTHVAIRRVNLDLCAINFTILQNEVVLSQQLQHEKVLPIRCTFIYNHELWSVSPLMAFGSSHDLIHAHFTGGLPEQAIAYILRDILLALDYLHSHAIIHRGVRASHVLIAANGRVCLSGLRDAYGMIRDGRRFRNVHDFPTLCSKSLQWFAPEILEQNLKGYDTKSDIYSMGILACELANGWAPYTEMSATQMLLEKVNGIKPVLLDSTTLPPGIVQDLPNTAEGMPMDSAVANTEANNRNAAVFAIKRTFSRHFHNFVDLCLEKDPCRRPMSNSLLGHPFLKNLKKRSTDILPGLLYPVTPLTNISDLPRCDIAMEEATEQLADINMANPWNFE